MSDTPDTTTDDKDADATYCRVDLLDGSWFMVKTCPLTDIKMTGEFVMLIGPNGHMKLAVPTRQLKSIVFEDVVAESPDHDILPKNGVDRWNDGS